MPFTPGTKVELRQELRAFDPQTKEDWIIEEGEICTVLERKTMRFEGREVIRYFLAYSVYDLDLFLDGIPEDFISLSLPHRAPEA